MSKKKAKKETYRALLANVKEEMAEPRLAESVQLENAKHRAVAVKGAAKT
jgi:hypothetical protein